MRNELETKATSFALHWIGTGSWVGTNQCSYNALTNST
jgi:hypothetical protein